MPTFFIYPTDDTNSSETLNSQTLFPMPDHLGFSSDPVKPQVDSDTTSCPLFLYKRQRQADFKSLWHSITYLHFWPLLSHPIDWLVIILHLVYLNFWQYVIFSLPSHLPLSFSHTHLHTHIYTQFLLGGNDYYHLNNSAYSLRAHLSESHTYGASASVTLY